MPSSGLDKPHNMVKKKNLVELNLFFRGYVSLFFFIKEFSRALLQFLRRLERDYLLRSRTRSHEFNGILI